MKYNVNRGLILSLASDTDVYKRGEKIYANGNVTDIGFQGQEKPTMDIIWARVCGLSINDYNVRIFFTKDGNYSGHKCTCNSSSIWKGACTHVVATLFSLCDENSLYMEKTRSALASKNITDFFENNMLSKVEEEFVDIYQPIRKATLKPTLYVEDDNKPFLKFSIGYDKFYIIKNLKDFTMQIAKHGTVKYGKTFEFKHEISSFDETSKKLIQLLLMFYSHLLEMDSFPVNAVYKHMNINYGDIFFMPKKFIDNFFQIYDGDKIMVSAPNISTDAFSVNITPEMLGIPFKIEYIENKIVLSGKHKALELLEGEDFSYIIIENKVYKLEKEKGLSISKIQKEICKLKENTITFKQGELSRFMYYVYPNLKDMDLIEQSENLPIDFIIQDLNIKFYLDLEPKNKFVICKLIFEYIDGEINSLQNDAENTYRNTYKELRAVNFLKKYGFQDDAKNGHYFLVREDNIFEFYLTGVEIAHKIGKVFGTDAFSERKIRKLPKANFNMHLKGNFLEFEFNVPDFSKKELIEIFNSYHVKRRYHRLKDGTFISLENSDLNAVADVISVLDIKQKQLLEDKILLSKYRAFTIDDTLNNHNNINLFRDEKINNIISDINNFKNLNYKIPQSLQKILRPYQKTGFTWLKTLAIYDFGGILADDMGLGKTLQIITLFLADKEKTQKPSLVVTPTSLMYNWEHEIKKFAPQLETVVLAGLPPKRKELLEQKSEGIIFITTYDTLKRDIENYEKIEFEYLVADEAQYIKNPKTQSSIALKSVKSRVRFALTGTPIENSLQELWSIFDFIMPGYLYSSSKFSKIFESQIIKADDQEICQKLQSQIAPFVLRRLKSQVLKELPNKVETTLFAEMEPEQKKIYLAYLMDARGEINRSIAENDLQKNQIQIFSHLTRLRQICCHPQLFIENYAEGSGKLELTIETINNAIASNHRILLFSQFTSMLDILVKKLKKEKISFFYLDGGTDAKLRKNMADKFNDGEKSVFLISLKAGGVGLNLTGADVVIHYDQWWNPAVMNQATDRAHRYGQKKVVQVINIITKDSIEEKILILQEKKKFLADSVITEGTNFITKMTEEEIKNLFR